MTVPELGHSPIPPGHRAELNLAVTRLRQRFDDQLSVATIEQFLQHAYVEVADGARVSTWLPMLAERLAEHQLRGLARLEGRTELGLPVVLFLSETDAGRSQMAEGFFAHLAGDRAMCWSGGSHPGTHINPAAVQVMAERGIDISTEDPKPWTEDVIRASDIVIVMGWGETGPDLFGQRYEEWDVASLEGLDLTEVRLIRDDIERRVHALLEQVHPTATA